MKCTDKEWQHCRVEKMGCSGCYYDDNDTTILSEEELKALNTNNWVAGVNIIIKHWNHTYGEIGMTNSKNEHILELTTGGWSENEEFIDKLSNTMFWILWWQESHRGGYFKFEYKGG